VSASDNLETQLERAQEAVDRAERAAEDARASEADLRDVAEFRERLIGVVSHDLRNPLNAITMAASLLASSSHLDDREAQLATRIVESSRRMKRIIAQLLDFTRARLGGGFPLELSKFDLGSLCERVAAELRLVRPDAVIDVTVRGDLVGSWDVDRMSAVVSNLLGNATEHAIPATPIRVDVRSEGPSVLLTIENEGEPIAPDVLATLFEPFHQADPSAQRASGNLGLGLYIAHEIIRSHGGAVAAFSRGGRTTFSVRVPRSTAA
jgi:signal transduction histidine kinase